MVVGPLVFVVLFAFNNNIACAQQQPPSWDSSSKYTDSYVDRVT